jgi:hypothetical protein
VLSDSTQRSHSSSRNRALSSMRRASCNWKVLSAREGGFSNQVSAMSRAWAIVRGTPSGNRTREWMKDSAWSICSIGADVQAWLRKKATSTRASADFTSGTSRSRSASSDEKSSISSRGIGIPSGDSRTRIRSEAAP